MIDIDDVFLEKAEECLEGAQSEFANRRYNNVANRCYYAVYQAAIYALRGAGVNQPGGASAGVEWPHELVRAQFIGQLINRRKVYPPGIRATLEENRALRQTADYRRVHITEIRAERAIRRTQQFLVAVRSHAERMT